MNPLAIFLFFKVYENERRMGVDEQIGSGPKTKSNQRYGTKYQPRTL